jgi:hypothetical protein
MEEMVLRDHLKQYRVGSIKKHNRFCAGAFAEINENSLKVWQR